MKLKDLLEMVKCNTHIMWGAVTAVIVTKYFDWDQHLSQQYLNSEIKSIDCAESYLKVWLKNDGEQYDYFTGNNKNPISNLSIVLCVYLCGKE